MDQHSHINNSIINTNANKGEEENKIERISLIDDAKHLDPQSVDEKIDLIVNNEAEIIAERSDFKRMMKDCIEKADLLELQNKAIHGNLLQELSKHNQRMLNEMKNENGKAKEETRKNEKSIIPSK